MMGNSFIQQIFKNHLYVLDSGIKVPIRQSLMSGPRVND